MKSDMENHVDVVANGIADSNCCVSGRGNINLKVSTQIENVLKLIVDMK